MAVMIIAVSGCGRGGPSPSRRGTIRGRVIDSRLDPSGKEVPLSGLVFLDDQGYVPIGKNGEYEFISVGAGKHKLRAVVDGYAALQHEVTVVADQVVECNIELEQDPARGCISGALDIEDIKHEIERYEKPIKYTAQVSRGDRTIGGYELCVDDGADEATFMFGGLQPSFNYVVTVTATDARGWYAGVGFSTLVPNVASGERVDGVRIDLFSNKVWQTTQFVAANRGISINEVDEATYYEVKSFLEADPDLPYYEAVARLSTGIVEGFVTDQSTGAPIPFAQVIVRGWTFGSGYANKDGWYRFQEVPERCSTVKARANGYIPTISHDLVVSHEIPARLDFYLTPEQLTALSVEPASARAGVGDEIQFTARGRVGDRVGDVVSPVWSVVSITGSGSITQDGLFTATGAGRVRVKSELEGAEGSAWVDIAQSGYHISGTVATSSGLPITGIRIFLGNGYGTVTADDRGRFTAGPLEGAVTVTPICSSYLYDPPTRTVMGHAENVNFVGTLAYSEKYMAYGNVMDGSGNAVPGVVLSLSNGGGRAVTDEWGSWRADSVVGETTVTPYRTGWAFSPKTAVVSKTNNEANFVAVPVK